MSKANRKPLLNVSGLAMTEFVLILPMLLFLMVSSVELGRAILQYNILSKSVRDGARVLANEAIKDSTQIISINSSTTTKVKNLVVYGTPAQGSNALLPGFSSSNVTLDAPTAIHVRVSANYTFQSLFGGTIPSFGIGSGGVSTPVTLSAEVTMRAL